MKRASAKERVLKVWPKAEFWRWTKSGYCGIDVNGQTIACGNSPKQVWADAATRLPAERGAK